MTTTYALRVCRADMTSRDGFVWPSEIGAVVKAPDWNPAPVCGGGLHGWLHGRGDPGSTDYWRDPEARWLVLAVDAGRVVPLEGKGKFPEATVAFVGDLVDAAAWLIAHDPEAIPSEVIGVCLSGQHVAVADLGVATAG